MAAKRAYTFLLLALSTFSFIINFSKATDCVGSGAISVYWGQHTEVDEGSLREACDSGKYNIVIIQSLIVYDSGTTPTLNLVNHCGTDVCPCFHLEGTIKHCQELGIKVFLSIGHNLPGKTIQDRYSICSSSSPSSSSLSSDVNVTKKLADYLLENFLSGQKGPLGSVSLDGIDIADVPYGEHLHWDELVKILKALTNGAVYLSVAPQCVYPDCYLNAAIQTGLVDYIWVKFYDQNPCIYSETNPGNFWDAWNTWTSKVPNNSIFLGLTAYEDMIGYIKLEKLKFGILPRVKKASNYGGVMIWDRYADRSSDYSGLIKDSVPKHCRCVCDDELEPTGFYRMLG